MQVSAGWNLEIDERATSVDASLQMVGSLDDNQLSTRHEVKLIHHRVLRRGALSASRARAPGTLNRFSFTRDLPRRIES